MLEKLLERSGRFIVTHRLWVAVIAVWVIAAAVMIAFAPSLTEVGVMDEASFLPDNSGYLQAKEVLKEKFPDQVAGGQGLLVFYDPQGLDDEDLAYAEELAAWLSSSDAPAPVERVVSIFEKPELEEMFVSEDGQAMLMQVDFSTSEYAPATNEAVEDIRAHLAATAPAGLEVYLTGPVAIGSDMRGAVQRSTDNTTIATIILVIIVLLFVYRSPVASLVPLTTIAIAYLVARGLLGFLAQGGVEVSSMLDSLLVVLIFGVGTDYALFLISRFREEVGRGNGRAEAIVRTVSKIGPVITASAGTVIIGLLGMMAASFGMTRTNGPAMSLGIAIALLASLSLTPALLHLFGERLFWPFHRRLTHERIGEGLINWKKIGHFVTSRPLLTAVVVLGLLLAPYPAWPQMNSAFNILAEIPEDMDSARGFAVLEDHFATGEMAPLMVLITSPQGNMLEPDALHDIAQVTQALESLEGVDVVRSAVQPTGDPESSEMFRVDGQLTTMATQVREMLDAFADPAQLAALSGEEDPAEAFAMLQDYLDELGEKFPEVKEDAHYRDALATLDALSDRMAAMTDLLLVDKQLAMMADTVGEMESSFSNPQALLSTGEEDPAAGFALLRDYLTELAAAYPEVKEDAAYTDALQVLDELEKAMGTMQEQMLVSSQLQTLATGMEKAAEALSDPQALAKMGTSGQEGSIPLSGMEVLGQYLTDLGAAYPDIRTDPAYKSALERMGRLEETMAAMQERMSVEGQLTMMAEQLRQMGPMLSSPLGLAMAGSQATEQFQALEGYFTELGKAFPEVKENPAYADALAQLETLSATFTQVQKAQASGQTVPPEEMQQALAAVQEAVNALADDVEALKEPFVGRPDLVFIPQGMSMTSSSPLVAEVMKDMKAMQEELAGLAGDLDSLAETFAAKHPGATFISQALLEAPEAQAMMREMQKTLSRFAGDLRTLSESFAGKEARFAPAALMQQGEAAEAMEEAKAELTRFAENLEVLAETFAGEEAYLIPEVFLEQTPELEELLDRYFAKDRTATQLAVLLTDDPYSTEAMDTVDRIQEQLDETLATLSGKGYRAYVSGVTVMSHDVQRTVDRDFGKVQAVVVIGVFLVFVLLLRSLVAPIYLVLSVLLSYGTTMGLCTLLFQGLLGYESVNYIIPIIIFVLLVALGADYNIFLMSRVREETEKEKNVKRGVELASTYTGSIITSCGIILAGTFAALAVSPLKMLLQIGVAVAIGVLVDTFIVRSLLVPAIATLLGKWNWWPGRIS